MAKPYKNLRDRMKSEHRLAAEEKTKKMLDEMPLQDMSDLANYIDKRKKTDKDFSDGFEEGYGQFKIGVILRQTRESA